MPAQDGRIRVEGEEEDGDIGRGKKNHLGVCEGNYITGGNRSQNSGKGMNH